MFIEAGIDLDHVNYEGKTATMMTCYNSLDCPDVMKKYLHAGTRSSYNKKYYCSLADYNFYQRQSH